MKRLKEIAGVILLALIVFAWIGISSMLSPVGFLSQIENGYWAGYIQDTTGKTWILADFVKSGYERKMTVIAAKNYTGTFEVKIGSGDENFAAYSMKGISSPELSIEARQLYVGKRYIFQRLMAGRFGDFWERNSDDVIIGQLKNNQSSSEFAIERLPDENVPAFFEENISHTRLSLEEIAYLFQNN